MQRYKEKSKTKIKYQIHFISGLIKISSIINEELTNKKGITCSKGYGVKIVMAKKRNFLLIICVSRQISLRFFL